MSEPQEVAALAKRGRELLAASKNSRNFELRAYYSTPSEIAAVDLLQWFASNAETIISALESLAATPATRERFLCPYCLRSSEIAAP